MRLVARGGLFVGACCLPFFSVACGLADDPTRPPNDDELQRGLVVLYPGGSSAPPELALWAVGLRAAGIDEAIEIIAWGVPGDANENATDYEANRQRAAREAARLVGYMDDHPGCPVTLIGYSAGAAIAAWAAEALPGDYAVDRVILMGPDLSPDYDLTPMLDHTRDGGYYYWSPLDWETPDVISQFGTMDRVFAPSASSEGFHEDDPRLVAVTWNPSMLPYGNFGGHIDYLFNVGFIRDFVAPLVSRGHGN